MSRFLLILAAVGIVVGIGSFAWFESRNVPTATDSTIVFITGPLFLVAVGYLVIRYVVMPLSANDEAILRTTGHPREQVSTRVRIGIIWHTNAIVMVHTDRILIDTGMRVYVIMDDQLLGAGDTQQNYVLTRHPALAVEHSAPDLPSPVLVLLKPNHPVRLEILWMAGVRT